MLPVSSSIVTTPIPTSLVNIAAQGTSVAPVAYDSVVPSVSSPQVSNNARGNSAPPAEATAEAPPQNTEQDDQQLQTSAGSAQRAGSGASSTFIAQLAAQESSPQNQVILVQYEKLLAISSVKYKPSNAQKPSAAPSSVFGQIVHTEHAAPVKAAPVQHSAPVPQEAPVHEQAPEHAVAEQQPAPVEPQQLPPRAISAYAQSASRVATQGLQSQNELA
jgi:hypothetical protein